MSFKTCVDISEATSLESSLGLYLKPISRIKINVQLPKLTLPGQSISSWHVMEKIKETVRPDTFLYLKCIKITSTVIKFEGELETKATCERALARLRANGFVKLSGFADRLQIRAAHAASNGPTRHDWEAFYRDAKGVNEMRPGERPDTIKLEELPIRWFAESSKSSKPSERLLRKAFETFGRIRRLEIPSKSTQSPDSSVFIKTGCLQNDLLFEVYIQFEEYVEFVIAMESLRGKKLLYKDSDGKVFSAEIKVDFDRTNYLSDKNIKKRSTELKQVLATAFSSDTTKTHAQDEVSKSPQDNKCNISESKEHETAQKTAISSSGNEQRIKEAKFLLKELFLRVEKSERQKEAQEKITAGDVEKVKKMSRTNSDLTSKQPEKVLLKDRTMDSRSHKVVKKDATKRVTSSSNKNQYIQFKNRDNSTGREKRLRSPDKSPRREKHLRNTDKYTKREKRSRSADRYPKRQKRSKSGDKSPRREKRSRSGERSSRREKKNSKSTEKRSKNAGKSKSSEQSSKRDTSSKSVRKPSKIVEVCSKSAQRPSKVVELSSKSTEKSSKSAVKSSLGKEDVEMQIEKEKQACMRLEEKKMKERLVQALIQKRKNEQKLVEQERILKEKLLRNFRAREKLKLQNREELRKELSGRNVLKSVVLGTTNPRKKKL